MELAIDAVGEVSSVAVSERGELRAEITWASGRRHTPTLIPMVDRACTIADCARGDLELVIVDAGPGAYGGIRAGMAAAEGIAIALGLPCVAVGRLEIEAWAHVGAGDDHRDSPRRPRRVGLAELRGRRRLVAAAVGAAHRF